ncbi:MAG: GIN domain-containing protein, partial [Chitinophagaceae bacterium]
MKKIFLPFLLLITFTITIFAQKTINDPNVERREAKNFQAIELSSAFDVYLTQSNEESVAVSASETQYRENIKVEVRGGVLIIRYDGKGKWN